MAEATVKTVQIVDPRIEPQPDPVYSYVIGPTQNQYYKIPASGRSNSSLTFNNLTTLGIDRAYLDTFEIELSCTIIFNLSGEPDITAEKPVIPCPWDWTFESFPFNKCCDEARVNINGGSFFSQPMSYIRAKERYMNQYELSKCYENVCPCHKALCQTESGRNFNRDYGMEDSADLVKATPNRIGRGKSAMMMSDEALVGGFNNVILRGGGDRKEGDKVTSWENYYYENKDGNHRVVCHVTWREPLFVSPFSSRYDATYGRPLYNITSMDFSFILQNLGNMIRVPNMMRSNKASSPEDYDQRVYVTDYNINIDAAQLCYQVMTIPPILTKPLTTLVPYRRFVPYITDYNQNNPNAAASNVSPDGETITITSGVYTMNEIPTAIWVFCAPSKAVIQGNEPDLYVADDHAAETTTAHNCYDSNKLFGYIKQINISLANTTQILATAEVEDLYRIAKGNGCQDSFWSWAGHDTLFSRSNDFNEPLIKGSGSSADYSRPALMPMGAGSVLRLIPGVDLIVPDQPLIPAANANNMVFQCSAKFYVPPHSRNLSRYSLWLLFEYVGVAAISPGQCEITMNPLGSGEIMAVSPVMSATSEQTEGEMAGGASIPEKIIRTVQILSQSGVPSNLIKTWVNNDKAGYIAEAIEKGAAGATDSLLAMKRPRAAASGAITRGGAVMGRGLNDWV